MLPVPITIIVSKPMPSGGTAPVRNSPVILFNDNMTINRVGFTYQDGISVFLDVPSGKYLLMTMDPETHRFQVTELEYQGVDPMLNVSFSGDDSDRGKIIATVLVGAAKRGGVDVMLYEADSSVVFMSTTTKADGTAEFNGIVGSFDIEAIGQNPDICRARSNDVNVPNGPNVVVPVLLALNEGC